MNTSHENLHAIYEICLRGEVDIRWETCFKDLIVTIDEAGCRSPITTLRGPVPDQAALRGMLCKLWDLNLTLISVRLVEVDGEENQLEGQTEA